MRWVRRRQQLGGYLALVGLALQLILSFGHLHLNGIRGEATPIVAAGATPPASPTSPAQHPANDADDYCAICATIHLAATSFLPQAPQLPLPFVSQTIEHFDRIADIFIAPQRTPFQSRAPPLA